jgi:hypothetical protein
MYPPQQVRFVEPELFAGVRVGGAEPAVQPADPVTGLSGLRGGTEGDGDDVRRRPVQPSPRIVAIGGVLRQAGHRARVQGLQVQRPEAGDREDRLGVHPPGHRVRAEQAEVVVTAHAR